MDTTRNACLISVLLITFFQLCCCNVISDIRDAFLLVPDMPSQGPLNYPSGSRILKPSSFNEEKVSVQGAVDRFEERNKDRLQLQQRQLRYGKEADHVRYGKEAAPHLRYGKELFGHVRYGKEAAPHLRYGKEAAPHLRYGKEVRQHLRYGKEAAQHLRYGKEAAQHLRYGKEARQHLRYGKEAAPHLRYGKELAPHLRYGKEVAPHLRYGKEAAPHLRYGKEVKDHVRYGKEAAPRFRYGKKLSQYVRYGKEAADDLEDILKALEDNDNQQKADGIKQNEYSEDGETILKNLLLQDLIKTEEEQKIFEILKFLKEFDRQAAKEKVCLLSV